jgi:hypothetical protein
MDNYERALQLASEALGADPRSGIALPETPTTAGHMAAHLVASAAIRRRKETPEAGVRRHIEAGREAVGLLSSLVTEPRTLASGRVGSDWNYNAGFLSHYDEKWQVSGVVPGVFRLLPRMTPDLDTMQQRFRDRLAAAGLPKGELRRAVVREGSNPHGTEDDRPWTEFRLEMDDPRISLSNWIVDLGHKADLPLDASLRSYASQAVEVYLNAASLKRMADRIEMLCMDAWDDAPMLRLEGVSLYAVSLTRGGPLKDSVVMHASLTGLSEALTETPVRTVYTAHLGTDAPRHTTMSAIVNVQAERSRALSRIGGPTIDTTGRDLLSAAGHDVDAMIRGILTLDDREKRVSAGRGTKAWMNASGGRITSAVDITPEARWKHNEMEIRRTFPESVLSGLVGRSAHDVLNHPALRETRVTSASTRNGRTIVKIAPRWEPLT